LDGAAPNLQDVLRLRQQDTFVGRDSRLAEFQDNLRLPALHPDRRYIVNIHGIAGVGKSFLLQQFRRIAQAEGAASALVDEDYFDVVETMSALAAEFGRQDARLTEFEAQLATYRQRRRELESDPNAPLGDLITTTTVRAGLSLAKTVPVAGALTEFVDSDAVAAQANRFRTYLVQRFGKRSDIDLLFSPIEVLTRSFVDSINRVTAERQAVLFLDTFERTAPYLESWLLDLFSGKFGGLSANVVTVIAGQQSLADNRWSPLRSLIAAHPLEPFTEAEACGFLAQRGVTSEAVVDVILPLSGRIPMWLATLAENSPQDPGEIPDPSENAVKRFLKWEPDEERQKLAKAAALPRRFNRDILLAIPEAGDVADLFEWLLQLPFVSRAGEYWRYHDAVRDPMLRLGRITSPQRWRQQHQALAAHFAEEQTAIGLPEKDRWSDPVWQGLALEEAYHRVCAAPVPALPQALAEAVEATEEDITTARRWAAMLTDAGAATGAERLRSWGRRLTDLSKDQDDDTDFLTALIDSGELEPDHFARALAGRGESHRRQKRYEQSLADLGRALELRQDQARYFRWRGLTFRALNRFEEAVEDLTRSIDLDRTSGQAFAQRGIIYQRLGRSEEAFADLRRAIELEPENGYYRMLRGIEYRVIRRYEESLADFDRAIELDPVDDTNFRQRGIAFQMAGRYEEALADINQAIELDPMDESNLAERGYTYHLWGRPEGALADFGRALEINAEGYWTYALRGSMYRELSRFDEAVADFDRAVAIKPDEAWVLAERAAVYHSLHRLEEALFEFGRAIELDSGYQWAISQRGVVLCDMGRHEAALPDFDRAVELDSTDGWTILQRAEAYRFLGRNEAALADFDRVLELSPADDWTITNRAMVYRSLDRHEEALADFSRAMELSSDPYWDLMERGATLRTMGRLDDALADLDHAIVLAPDRAAAYIRRGMTYVDMDEYISALRDFDRAVDIDPDDEWTHRHRGHAHRAMGRYEEARSSFDRALQLVPESEPAFAQRGETHRLLGDLDAALADLDQAVALAPEDTWNLVERSMVHELLGNSEAAFADLDRILATDASQSWWVFLRAIVCKSAGRTEEGMAGLLTAVDLVHAEIEAGLDPVVSTLNLIVYFVALDRTEESRRQLDETLRSEPTPATVLAFIEDLRYLAACPGIEVEELEEFSRIATEYRDAKIVAEAE
jgi:tetratricopeptide (TPR) repeat protein